MTPVGSMPACACSLGCSHRSYAAAAATGAHVTGEGVPSACDALSMLLYTACTETQKADEEAAKVYEEFVESFKGDEGPGKDGGVKAFVRGGVVAPGSRSTDASGACGAGVWGSAVGEGRPRKARPCAQPASER